MSIMLMIGCTDIMVSATPGRGQCTWFHGTTSLKMLVPSRYTQQRWTASNGHVEFPRVLLAWAGIDGKRVDVWNNYAVRWTW